jgi:hypothetical protein
MVHPLSHCGGSAIMGMHMLDFSFRIERSFGVKIYNDDFNRLPARRPFDATAGEMHDWVTSICRERGVAVPWSSWNRVKLELANTLSKPLQVIHRDTFIVRDLGFS